MTTKEGREAAWVSGGSRAAGHCPGIGQGEGEIGPGDGASPAGVPRASGSVQCAGSKGLGEWGVANRVRKMGRAIVWGGGDMPTADRPGRWRLEKHCLA
jgi:hypothetical protein